MDGLRVLSGITVGKSDCEQGLESCLQNINNHPGHYDGTNPQDACPGIDGDITQNFIGCVNEGFPADFCSGLSCNPV